MRSHLYEFVSKTKKLKCLCGWERTLRTTDMALVYKKFEAHCAEVSRPDLS